MYFKRLNLKLLIEGAFILVTVTLSIRTFFCFPLVISSDSMSPILEGPKLIDVSSMEPGERNQIEFDRTPFALKRTTVIAKSHGIFHLLDLSPRKLLPGLALQRIKIGQELHWIWNPPQELFRRLEMDENEKFEAGDRVLDFVHSRGDILLVDRIRINFMAPRKSTIVVWKNRELDQLPKDMFYVKRLHAYTDKSGKLVGGVSEFIHLRGDNFSASYDSRHWGSISRESVVGTAICVIWPPSERAFTRLNPKTGLEPREDL